VVDGVPAARRRAVTLLRLAGFRVHEASGVVEAFAKADRYRPTLVVVDPDLPDGDGIDLLRELRRHGSWAQFLAVADSPTKTLRNLAVQAGAAACLSKPLEPGDLVAFLRGRTTGPAAQGGPLHGQGQPTVDWVLQQHALRVDSVRADRRAPRGPLRAAQLRDTYAVPLPRRSSPLGGDHIRRTGDHDRQV
jgi:DNA-binding response OmpR family regulator